MFTGKRDTYDCSMSESFHVKDNTLECDFIIGVLLSVAPIVGEVVIFDLLKTGGVPTLRPIRQISDGLLMPRHTLEAFDYSAIGQFRSIPISQINHGLFL